MINFISDSITILEPNDYIGCQSTFSLITESACGSYIAPSGAIYTTSQTVIDVMPNSANCDSIVTIDLRVHSIDTSVTSSGNILTANASNVTYPTLSLYMSSKFRYCCDTCKISSAVVLRTVLSKW